MSTNSIKPDNDINMLLQRNGDWAASMVAKDANFFKSLAAQQNPEKPGLPVL